MMSAAAAPPPPPPPGGGPGKGFPGHNSPGKNKATPRKDTRKRGDGRTKETAWWTQELWDNPVQRQYLVHRRTNELPSRWVRTTEGDARYDAQTGFTVWELGARAGRRVNLAGGTQFQPFQWQYTQIVTEEQRRVAQRKHLPGEEDILDGTRRSGSMTSAPATPTRRGPGSTSSPLGPGSSPGGRGSGSSSRGRGSASSPRRGPSSPMSPTAGKGRGRGDSGFGDRSPGGGTAS